MKRISLTKAVKLMAKAYKEEREKAEKTLGKVEVIGGPIPVSGAVGMQGVVGEAGELAGREKFKTIGTTKGIAITEVPRMPYKPPEVDIRTINIVYPLIPKKPVGAPFAAANIRWSASDNALVYYLLEAKLNENEKKLLNMIKATLIERLDIDFTTLRKEEAKEYLKKRFEEAVATLAPSLPKDRQAVLLYYIERDFIGLERIEPLIQDPEIEDISCDGVGVPIYIYHRNPLIGSVKTNVMFETAEELDKFVTKVAQRCNKTISVAQPLLDASLPDGSRVQATLGTDIARRGSNITIRKFTEIPLTPVHLIRYKTLDPRLAAFLWLTIEYGRSILISGGTASGKTSLLNAISLFIRPEMKIVSIEDTAELRLPHTHWVPHVARKPIAELEGKKLGEVDLFELLRSSLRQRPDYLIVGEVRGKEAFVLFQQISTGHPSLATIHADNMERLIDRLTTQPISLPPSLLESLDLIVFIIRIKHGNVYVRRITGIYEITGFDRAANVPIINQIFKWNPTNDKYETVNPSFVLKKIVEQYGISEAVLLSEIAQRTKIIEWMVENNIDNYKDVARIMKVYYTEPERLLDVI